MPYSLPWTTHWWPEVLTPAGLSFSSDFTHIKKLLPCKKSWEQTLGDQASTYQQSLGSILPLHLKKNKFNSSQETEGSSSPLPEKFNLMALEPLVVAEESRVYISWSGRSRRVWEGVSEPRLGEEASIQRQEGVMQHATALVGYEGHPLVEKEPQPDVGTPRQGKRVPKRGKGQWQQREISYIQRDWSKKGIC